MLQFVAELINFNNKSILFPFTREIRIFYMVRKYENSSFNVNI